jgi:D-glycero-D-manno-heptose 1,7-bisphosphate phosphatase
VGAIGSTRPGVFLDRDGTVIEDRHYLADPEGVALLPGAAAAIARLNRAGLPVLLVTNQSGIGRGYFTEADFEAVQRRVISLLTAEGARLDGVYYCPHAPQAFPTCDCRKPATGLFLRAAEEHGIDPGRSLFVGDRLRDVLPARTFGGSAYLVRGDTDEVEEAGLPAWVWAVGSLAEAVDRALGAVHSD